MSNEVEGGAAANPSPAIINAKGQVLNRLYQAKKESDCKIVRSPEIQAAIQDLNLDLSVGNPANFLKDIIRRKTANDQWPDALKDLRVTARQRFRQQRVFEFIPYIEGFDEPFPDRFEPTEHTPIFDVQSISLPSAARRLGREDETWLTQVMVNLRIVESQLAFRSRELDGRIRDIVHLQTGMKTQPEIDATFILTAAKKVPMDGIVEEHLFITCEVKRKSERLLEDQVRFQVHQGFKETAKLKDPCIDAVKPIVMRLMNRDMDGKAERLIYVVEFKSITRSDYQANWRSIPGSRKPKKLEDDTPVYGMPLESASDGFFRVKPDVRGVSHR